MCNMYVYYAIQKRQKCIFKMQLKLNICVQYNATTNEFGILVIRAFDDRHLNFKKKYPFVRVTEDLQTGAFEYMAADQIKLKLADGIDVTELKPMLEALNLRLRMFNRKEQIAVIGVLNTEIDAVPVTIEAVQPYATLFSKAEPDFLEFK